MSPIKVSADVMSSIKAVIGYMHCKKMRSMMFSWIQPLKTISRGNVHDTILTFHNLYKYNCLVNLYKAYRMGNLSFFHDSIVNLGPTHEHVTRRVGQNYINIPLYLKSRCQQSFLFNACKFWNELPAHIKSINEFSKFQMKCKETLLNNQNFH